DFGVPTRTILVRWRTKAGQLKHALYLVTDLQRPIEQVCQHYDLRGGAEVEIRNDKQGLLLTHRRKRSWTAQAMLVLLNDLAHNLLTCFRHLALAGTALEGYGAYRLIQEALQIPGELVLDEGRLVAASLQKSHPHAQVMAEALLRFWKETC
ncbi:MAG: transposase, partial [Omnitrophica WOR_2 bacterium]